MHLSSCYKKLNSLSLRTVSTGVVLSSLLGLLSSCSSGSDSQTLTLSTQQESQIQLGDIARSNLVAAYDFDDDNISSILDSSGNGYHGTASTWNTDNERGTLSVGGLHGNALLFSENGRVEIHSNTSLDDQLSGDGIAISIWFSLNDLSLDGNVRLVSKKPEWFQTEGFELEINPALRRIRLLLQGEEWVEASIPAEDFGYGWHHIYAHAAGTHGLIQYDGEILTDTTIPPVDILACPHQLTIGALANGNALPVAPFSGSLDDVRIYDIALSTTQRQQLFADGQSAQSLRAWWSFSEDNTTIIDESGMGHSGNARMVNIEDAQLLGNSAYFDGQNAAVSIDGSAESLSIANSMTISAWVHATNASNEFFNRIISKKSQDDELSGFDLSYQATTQTLAFTGSGLRAATLNVDLTDGWHHVTVVVNADRAQFYIDGAAAGGSQEIQALRANDHDVMLGYRANSALGLIGGWEGYLDEIRIYDYVLSLSEINDIRIDGMLAATDAPAAGINPGVRYDYYEGRWSQLPDFDTISPLISNAWPDISLDPRQSNSDFAFRFTGFIEIPRAGTYTFFTTSDDGSKLLINGLEIVDNDGLHGSQERSGSIALAEGLHPFELQFFERSGNEVLNWAWSGPGLNKEIIPATALSYGIDSNYPPVIRISTSDNNAGLEGDAMTFTASAQDVEDLDLSSLINWTSSIDGNLGQAASITTSTLSTGTHTITATVTDSDSNTVDHTITYEVLAAGDLRSPDNPAGTISGIIYEYYEGNWSLLPDFDALSVLDEGTLSSISLSPKTVNDYYAFRFRGYIDVPQDGLYTFSTSSDDGSQLFIGNELIVDNDGLHGVITRSGRIALAAGLHELTVTFFERNGGDSLSVSWASNHFANTEIPGSALQRLDQSFPPRLSILEPSGLLNGAPQGTTVTLSALATDSTDGTITNIQWHSDQDGALGTGSTINVSLSDNIHIITASVTDSDSNTVQRNISLVMMDNSDPGVNRALWTNIGGTTLNDLTSLASYPDNPDSTDTRDEFSIPVNSMNNFGTKLHAWLVAPVSGTYTFWIASDDQSELSLSTDENPSNAVVIASVPQWTNHQEYDKFSQQKSVTINLVAGEQYYIEAIQKEGGGGDNCSVAWSGPGFSRQIIDDAFLKLTPTGNN